MKKIVLVLLCTGLLTACAGTASGPSGSVKNLTQKVGVKHPAELSFAPLSIDVPDDSLNLHPLLNGNLAYIVEDPSLPLIKVTLYSRAGNYLLQGQQPAVAALTGAMLRDGGTQALSPEALDEKLDFLATDISVNIGANSAQAALDTLAENFDESLTLLFDVLTEPRFDAERLQIAKGRLLENMRRRNDDTRAIEPRVWGHLLRGEDFFTNSRTTQDTVERLSAEAMREHARQVFANGQLVIAVSGAIDPATAVSKLNAQLQRLPAGTALPEIPRSTQPVAAGLYGVNKDDVNQTRVRLGHPAPMRSHPDFYAIAVMNEILGGGGFTSRLVKRIRSDEGLAYSAGSRFQLGRFYPGEFRAAFQSKNESVAKALAIALEEIQRIRSEPVSEQELNTAKESVIAILNELYTNSSEKANRFASDAINREAEGFWANFEANVRKVTISDVQRVAQEHLKPEQLRILLTGKLTEALAGDGSSGTVQEVTGLELEQLPLRDPLTLKPLPLN